MAAGGKESSLLLSNPMTCSDISPGASSAGGHVTSNGDGGLSLLARTSERTSLRKIRPKSPSLLRFFVRGSTRKSSADDDDGGGGGGGAGAGGSSGSDQDEAFSVSHLHLASNPLCILSTSLIEYLTIISCSSCINLKLSSCKDCSVYGYACSMNSLLMIAIVSL